MDKVPTMKEWEKMAQRVNHSSRTVTEVMNVLIYNNLFYREKVSIPLHNAKKSEHT